MVRQLGPPGRPLPKARFVSQWKPPPVGAAWAWCRVYHRSAHTPDGTTFRPFGPLARFDHHTPTDPPTLDAGGRRVLYVGGDLATSACEVFGATGEAQLCTRWRVSIVAPHRPLTMFDLTAAGAAMAIGALPALADGNEARVLTQEWARAIYEDRPAGKRVTGIAYRSGYNHGPALALWDCEADVEILADSRGARQDFALQDPRILRRFQAEMRQRRIGVTTVPDSACAQCSREDIP